MIALRLLVNGVIVSICTTFSMPAIAKVTSGTLENGMDVIVIEDHRAPVVVHMVWYKAGSADETAGASGVAHFLEHLLFKGTETLAPGEFSKTVAAQGGTDNAFTSYDYTAYYQRVASDRLGIVMRMEADRMRNVRLSDEDIVTERDVIIEERNMRVENNPNALYQEQLRAQLFRNHRYGTPIIGWRHEMETLTREDALAYYEHFYAPNNAILIVAGDVQPQDVFDLANRFYGAIPKNRDLAPRKRTVEPRALAERRLIYRDARVAQPLLSRSYVAPERDPGDQREAAALTLLARLLGGGQSSILTQKMQFEQSVAVYTGAYYDALAVDDSSFVFYVVPTSEVSLEDAEAKLDEVLAQFLTTQIDPDHLARIKKQFAAARIYAEDDIQGLARRYGGALAVGLSLADVDAWPEVIQSITAEEIIQAATRILDPTQSVTGFVMGQELNQ